MIELFTPNVILYAVYAVLTLFSLGIFVASPARIRGTEILACFIGAFLWPIFLPFWFGTAVRSALEKYLVS